MNSRKTKSTKKNKTKKEPKISPLPIDYETIIFKSSLLENNPTYWEIFLN